MREYVGQVVQTHKDLVGDLEKLLVDRHLEEEKHDVELLLVGEPWVFLEAGDHAQSLTERRQARHQLFPAAPVDRVYRDGLVEHLLRVRELFRLEVDDALQVQEERVVQVCEVHRLLVDLELLDDEREVRILRRVVVLAQDRPVFNRLLLLAAQKQGVEPYEDRLVAAALLQDVVAAVELLAAEVGTCERYLVSLGEQQELVVLHPRPAPVLSIQSPRPPHSRPAAHVESRTRRGSPGPAQEACTRPCRRAGREHARFERQRRRKRRRQRVAPQPAATKSTPTAVRCPLHELVLCVLLLRRQRRHPVQRFAGPSGRLVQVSLREHLAAFKKHLPQKHLLVKIHAAVSDS